MKRKIIGQFGELGQCTKTAAEAVLKAGEKVIVFKKHHGMTIDNLLKYLTKGLR